MYFYYAPRDTSVVVVNNPVTPTTPTTPVASSTITYQNTDYGFTFTLPMNWQGYSVMKDTWKGTTLTSTTAQSGPKLLIRNPKWTASAPYEDLPVLVFTISQWDAYLAEKFSVFAAPVKATELARNNVYVFVLPPRWDFDYSLDFKEAQNIIASNPLRAFNVGVSTMPTGKLNVNLICERATMYMTFTDTKSANAFIADCKEGKHPEVIEKYKVDMNLGTGAAI